MNASVRATADSGAGIKPAGKGLGVEFGPFETVDHVQLAVLCQHHADTAQPGTEFHDPGIWRKLLANVVDQIKIAVACHSRYVRGPTGNRVVNYALACHSYQTDFAFWFICLVVISCSPCRKCEGRSWTCAAHSDLPLPKCC